MARYGRLALVVALLTTLGLLPTMPVAAATPGEAVNDAVGYAAARSVTEFISVVDRSSGAILAQTPNAQSQVASESIMKLLLASYYLVSYGGYQSTPAAVRDRLSYMLRFSDNGTTNDLFTPSAIPTIAGRYGMGHTSNATDRVGHWGAARITAGDMTQFLYRAANDPAVGPWLIPVMAQTAPNGSDGFDQFFGLNAVGGDHGSKQGWGCDSYFTSPTCAIHSVGYTDRTFVAILQLSGGYPDPMRETSTHAARAVAQARIKPDPVGALDIATNPAQGAISVAGWAADPAAPGRSEQVHLYVTGPAGTRGYAGTVTSGGRPDVAAALPWAGPSAGFTATVGTQGAGLNTVCAYAINVDPPNTNPMIGCRSVQVRDAVGVLDQVSVVTGQLVVAGWALNPNNPAEPVEVHVYDTGPSGTRGYPGFRAGNSRPDVATAFPGYGSAHGYTAVIPSLEPGTHNVCSYAITTGGGNGNTLLGCRSVEVRDPFGSFDLLGTNGGNLVAAGWALNPNNPPEHVEIHVFDFSATGTRRYTGFLASTGRPDVAAAYPGFGPDHGYWAEFPAVSRGLHTVCTYAISTGGGTGSNPLLGCRALTIP